MKKIFQEWEFFWVFLLVVLFSLAFPHPRKQSQCLPRFKFLSSCFFIIVCLYPRPVGTMGQILLLLGTSAEITFSNKQELRNIHCVPLTAGSRHLLYSEKNLLTY